MLIKKTTLTFILILISASLFAFEGIEKKANTKDGYNFKLYQVDKTEKPKCYEYYVQLTSDDSEEYFIWCFDKLNEAMEHFKWLEETEVIETKKERENSDFYAFMLLFGKMTYGEAKAAAEKEKIITKKEDKRKDWRVYSFKASKSDNYINYWILKEDDEIISGWR